MRRSGIKTGLITFGIVGAIIVSFVIGLYVGERWAIANLSVELDSTQAMLAFNRIVVERRMQSLLSRGCMDAAMKEVDIDEDQDTRLLAEFFKGKLTPWTRKYVSDRDPNLVGTLSTFKSKYGSVWEQPDCHK